MDKKVYVNFLSFREKSGLHFLVLQSYWRLVRYHLGTVAFGSFIIALIQFIRMIMKYVEKQLKKRGADNQFFTMCLKVMPSYYKFIVIGVILLYCNTFEVQQPTFHSS